MPCILPSSAVRVKRSPPSAAATATTHPPAACGPGHRTHGGTRRRTRCCRTCAPPRRPNSPTVMRTGRIAEDTRPRMVMVPPRRTWRRRRGYDHRPPCVANDCVLHNDRLVRGRLDARAVAVGADGRSIGMGHNLHAIANRAERAVNPAAVHPCAGRRAPSRENQRRSRKNRQIVLVQNTPPISLRQARRMKRRNLTKIFEASDPHLCLKPQRKGPRKPRPLVHPPNCSSSYFLTSLRTALCEQKVRSV